MKDSDKPKLIIAIVLFILAGVVIAWSLGLFSSSTSSPQIPADQPPARKGGARTIDG